MVLTGELYGDQHFSMAFKKVNNATHWISEDGEQHDITPHFKIMYNYILDQYRSYNKQGKDYFQSQQSIADHCGMSYDHVKKNLVPLLKLIGLLEITKVSHRRYTMLVRTPKKVTGKFINVKIKPSDKPVREREPLTEEQFTNYKNNQDSIALLHKQIELLQNDIFLAKPKKVGFEMRPKK